MTDAPSDDRDPISLPKRLPLHAVGIRADLCATLDMSRCNDIDSSLSKRTSGISQSFLTKQGAQQAGGLGCL